MIFTFYSYKGGVGRSMALANIAELLYDKGSSVLVIDWDLDSPGLETYFPRVIQKAKENVGLLNMLLHYKNIVSQDESLRKVSLKITEKSFISLEREEIPKDVLNQLERLKNSEYFTEKEFVKAVELVIGQEKSNKYSSAILKYVYAEQLQFGDIQDYIVDIYSESDSHENKSLKILSAGKRDGKYFGQYVELFKSFDWKDFYEHWAGEQYFEWFRRQLENVAPIILIDSRNGVNEMSGVCTRQLADIVVAFTSSNVQSIEGIEKVVMELSSSKLQQTRPDRSRLGIVVIPARVEQGELAARNAFENKFKKKFHALLPESWRKNGHSFWDLKIPYVPLYAFEELVAVREKRENGSRMAQELVEAYEQIWDAMVATASPPGAEPWRWRELTDKVLIIENVPAWQSVLKKIVVAKAGGSCDLAETQESAKSLLTDNDYKLVILNLNLSSGTPDSPTGYEGFDILNFLKATGRTIPILLIGAEVTRVRTIFEQYPYVVDFFFKGQGGENFAKDFTDSIRKQLAIQNTSS